MSSAGGSDPTYSSIHSLSTNEDDTALAKRQDDDDNPIIDDDEGNFFCEMNIHTDRYRLCKVKAAHDAVPKKREASSPKKPLTATKAPHLDTKALIAKLDEVTKTIDLDVSNILAEQIKDPVLGTVRSCIQKKLHPNPKIPKFNNQKDFYDTAKSLTDF